MWFLVAVALAQISSSDALEALYGPDPAHVIGSVSWTEDDTEHTLWVARRAEEDAEHIGAIVYAGSKVVARDPQIVAVSGSLSKATVQRLSLGPGHHGALVQRGTDRWVLHAAEGTVHDLAFVEGVDTTRVKSCVSTCEIVPAAIGEHGYADLLVAPVDRGCGIVPPSPCRESALLTYIPSENGPSYQASEQDGLDKLRAGRMALATGDADNAMVRLTSCTARAPKLPQCWWELGWASWAHNDFAGALKAWETVEELNPAFPELAEHLGKARERVR